MQPVVKDSIKETFQDLFGSEEGSEALKDMSRMIVSTYFLYRGLRRAPSILAGVAKSGQLSRKDAATLVSTAGAFSYYLAGQLRLGWEQGKAVELWSERTRNKARNKGPELRVPQRNYG